MGPAGAAVLRHVLVPNIGQVRGGVDIVPDPLLWEFDVLESLSDVARLRLARGLSARLRGVDKLESLCDSNKIDKRGEFHL